MCHSYQSCFQFRCQKAPILSLIECCIPLQCLWCWYFLRNIVFICATPQKQVQQQYSTLFLFQQTSIRVSCCSENLHQVKFCRNKAKYKVVLGGVGARLRRTFSHMANTSEVEKVFTIITLRYCTNYRTFLLSFVLFLQILFPLSLTLKQLSILEVHSNILSVHWKLTLRN